MYMIWDKENIAKDCYSKGELTISLCTNKTLALS